MAQDKYDGHIEFLIRPVLARGVDRLVKVASLSPT